MKLSPVPVALFAYARPEHLRATLEGLRANEVPLIYAFSDGPATEAKRPAVAAVRKILAAINWCRVIHIEHNTNLGLGRSIRGGVSQILKEFESVIAIEDDLVLEPGAYQFMAAALDHYRDAPQAMAVTAWSHPRLTPADAAGEPFWDGRLSSWSWGTWRKVWQGMTGDAMDYLRLCRERGIDINRFGADLPIAAFREKSLNIWAVRFCYYLLAHGGLCLRPPWNLVHNSGFDSTATNAATAGEWNSPARPLSSVKSITWPDALENPEIASLWQRAYGHSLPGYVALSLARRARLLWERAPR